MPRLDIPRRSFLAGAAAIGPAAMLGSRVAFAADADLTVGVPTDLTGLDPADVNDTLSQSACRLMLQGLYGFDKDMKLIPVLAESYTANESATEFVFKLRTGISFHDGTPFDADAVVVNFNRVSNPAGHLKRTSLFAMIAKTEALDPQTVKFTLKTPFGAFVPTIAHPAGMILSPKAIKEHPQDLSRNPVGTGAFTFVSWTTDTLKVAKNDKYWKPGFPKFDTVTFRSVPENGSRIAMLQTGEAQFIYPVPPEMMRAIDRSPTITVINAPSIIERYVAINVRKQPFDDIRVRQALNYAVDKSAYAKVVWSGYEDVADSPIPPHLSFYSRQDPWPYDPAKAKQLLAAAGHASGVETEIWGNTTTISQRGMQFIQQQLALVGIKVNVVPLEAGLLDQKIWSVQKPDDSQLQMYYGGWSASTGDADWGLRPLFWTGGFPPVLYNVGYYSNPDVDKDLVGGLSTADASARAQFYADAQSRIWKDAPWIFLGVDRILAAHSKKLASVYQMPDGGLLIDEGSFIS
jgi:glutathione transport system substrate-binding protein